MENTSENEPRIYLSQKAETVTSETPKFGTKRRKAHKDSTSINEIDNPKEEIIASEFSNRIPW